MKIAHRVNQRPLVGHGYLLDFADDDDVIAAVMAVGDPAFDLGAGAIDQGGAVPRRARLLRPAELSLPLPFPPPMPPLGATETSERRWSNV